MLRSTLVMAAVGLLSFFGPQAQAAVAEFPSGDSAFHTYEEIGQELTGLQSRYPALAKAFSLGKSAEKRELWALKLAEDVQTDKDQPEVLFICNQHAREHITTEMCLRIAQRYVADPALLAGRTVYLVPTVNPDGKEYDIAGGSYHNWRKNRQGQGTDPNRNWGYQWGCCGGSSTTPSAEDYRGPAAFSAPETAAVRDFVNSRKVGGKQRITGFIDFHNYGQLVLWPYSYTQAATAPGLSTADRQVLMTMAQKMAAINKYTPQQSSALYPSDGDSVDWMWGTHRIYGFTFEMVGGPNGFYVPGSQIEAATKVNDGAVDLLVKYADCVPRIAGQTC
ncbi:zinc carboxypeptidase [Pseudonocardiaceae bacterium YIM PH 21723]|nr:zinc carboxypeptidase [Pseudonocardiaceae bacterium YIM PH 21723]